MCSRRNVGVLLLFCCPSKPLGMELRPEEDLSTVLAEYWASLRFEELYWQQERSQKRLWKQADPSVARRSNASDQGFRPADLLKDDECLYRNFAFFTRCVTDEQRILDQCFASICSLLATTDPPCVVVFVSRWAYEKALATFTRNGVVVTIAPEWANLPTDHPYAHLTGSTGNASFNRDYTFVKFEVARLTQYERAASFDPDIIFMRNASGLENFQSFAASRVPKGKRPDVYINNGMMVIRPSPAIYNGLVQLWRSGDFSLYYSDKEATDQDVFTELCWIRRQCGPVADLDACVWNHGTWIPNKFGRHCPAEAAVSRHNFKPSREPLLARNLADAFRLGTCRMSTLGLPAIHACFDGFVNEAGDEFTFEFCCLGTSPSGDRSGGNTLCWSEGSTYERCCLGSHDAVHLQADLTAYGDSWYGLSSVPDHPPKDWLDGLCLVSYARNRLTMGSLSPLSQEPASRGFYRSEGWPFKAPTDATVGFAHKCRGAHGVLVVFRFTWGQYRAQHRGHALLEQLDNLLAETLGDDRTHLRDMACIPNECVVKFNGEKVSPPRRALRVVLWSYVLERHLRISRFLVERLPAPLFEFFDQLYTFDDADMSNLVTLDHLL